MQTKKEILDELVKEAEISCNRIDKTYHLVVISGQLDKIKKLEAEHSSKIKTLQTLITTIKDHERYFAKFNNTRLALENIEVQLLEIIK